MISRRHRQAVRGHSLVHAALQLASRNDFADVADSTVYLADLVRLHLQDARQAGGHQARERDSAAAALPAERKNSGLPGPIASSIAAQQEHRSNGRQPSTTFVSRCRWLERDVYSAGGGANCRANLKKSEGPGLGHPRSSSELTPAPYMQDPHLHLSIEGLVSSTHEAKRSFANRLRPSKFPLHQTRDQQVPQSFPTPLGVHRSSRFYPCKPQFHK
jgi:hypothetical protein